MFFCADHRAQLKKEQPDLKVGTLAHVEAQPKHTYAFSWLTNYFPMQVTEVAQVLGARWKDLDDKGKAKYTAQAE